MKILLAISLTLMLTVSASAQSLGETIGPNPSPLIISTPASPVNNTIAQPQGTTPVPDPTKLTTEAVDRAKADLKELFSVALAAVVQRLDAMQGQIDGRTPATMIAVEQLRVLLKEEIDGLRSVTLQKFVGVDQQFAGRDTALAAALLAQKTAVDEQNKSNALSIAKSDAATAKQIDTIGDNVATVTSGINEKVDDLRTRVQAIESRAIGAGETRSDTTGNLNLLFAAILAAGVLISGVVYVTRRPSEVHVVNGENGNGARKRA